MEENIRLNGQFRLEVIGIDGKLKETRDVPNTVMDAGKAEVAALFLTDVGGTAFDYLALGTSATAPNQTQTAMIAEVYRTASTGTRITTTVANDTAKLSGSFTITASNTLQEAGILNSSSAGTMFARTTYSGISVVSGDTVNATYTIKFN